MRSSVLLFAARVGALAFAAFFSAPFAEAVQPVRIVATGGRMGITNYPQVAGAAFSFRQRTPHKLGGPVAEMQIGFMDWWYPYDNETPNSTNDVTLTHVWLERASTGQVVPLTFSGSRQLVLPKNSTTPYWLSDPVPSSIWTGASPARDEVFWLHVKGTVPEGGKVPTGTPTSFPGARFSAFPPANDTAPVDVAGAVPTITGQTVQNSGLPLIFLGRYTGPGHLSVIGVGDSILDGTGDQANPAPVISGYGFFNRAALDTNGQNTIATFNLTRHGQSASNWVKTTRQTRQPQFLKFANVMVEEYGTNDIGQKGTGSETTLLTNVKYIWSTARAQGVQKIIRTNLMPRTDSTDYWATVENQTPNPLWVAKRDALDVSFAAARSEGLVDAILDTIAVIGAPGDNTRWLANGTAKYIANDSTHVARAGNVLLGIPLRAALLSLTIDDYAAWSARISWNGADNSPTADPDGDGHANLLEYALDTDPLSPASAPDVRITNIAGSLALTFTPSAIVGLNYFVESSTDLVAWTPHPIPAASLVAGSAFTFIDNVSLAGTPRRFLRLAVTR